ncbi:21505_t:CDS:2 [Gigaspora rosea]|nr:21505_t:CDS:2 [Gigaspora rosea]
MEVSLYINPSTSTQYGQTHNMDNMESEFNLNKPTSHVSEQTNYIPDNSIGHVGNVMPQIDLNKSIDYTPQESINCISYYSYCPNCQNYYYPYYSQISDPNYIYN